MSQEKSMLLMMKGVLSELGDEDKAKATELIARVRDIAEEAGDLAALVVGIVSIEIAIAIED